MESIKQKLSRKGYEFKPASLEILTFHSASKVGNLIYTSGQISMLGETKIMGRVGSDVSLEEAKKAAEICAFNCICAAGAVADVEEIKKVVKLSGFVNNANDFDDMSSVINSASEFFTYVFGKSGYHARTAIGANLPSNWAVEVEAVFEV